MTKGDASLWVILNDKLDLRRNQGQLNEALAVADKTLEVARRAFAARHPNLALSLEKLGDVLKDKGDAVRAEPLYREAWHIYHELLPTDVPALFRLSSHLG